MNNYTTTEGVYTPNNTAMTELYQVLELLKSRGVKVYLVANFKQTPSYAGGGYSVMTDAQRQKFGVAHAHLLNHLINTKGFTNIVHWCPSNELESNDGDADKFGHISNGTLVNMPRWKSLIQASKTAFSTYTSLNNLKLLSTDSTFDDNVRAELKWAADNMDSLVDVYGVHDYSQPGPSLGQNGWGVEVTTAGNWFYPDTTVYDETGTDWANPIFFQHAQIRMKEYNRYYTNFSTKPFVIGELGYVGDGSTGSGTSTSEDRQHNTGLGGLIAASRAMAAIGSGASAYANWEFNDFSYVLGSTTYYNHFGLFKLQSEGYAPYPKLYSLGLISRYFRGGSKTLSVTSSDDKIQSVAMKHNTDNKYSLAIMNRYDSAKSVTINLSGATRVRRYLYDSANVPANSSGDLPASDKTITLSSGQFTDSIPAQSMAVYTDEFDEVAPPVVTGLTKGISGQSISLNWNVSSVSDLAYYRIYRGTTASFTPSSSNQIASTVATTYIDTVTGSASGYFYKVAAVDIYGNVGNVGTIFGSGHGLKAEYYSGNALNTLISSQTDATVDKAWGYGSPTNEAGGGISSVGPDNFSVRWSGQVQAIEGGNYTFTTETDDGVRLWVNGTLVIDQWSGLGTFTTGNINLTAGRKYEIRMEYRELTGEAYARLKWTRPGNSLQIIPQSQLYRWVASASANSAAAGNAIDGQSSTRWDTGAGQSNGQWFTIDLGTPQNVSKITLDATGSNADYPRSYSVYATDDLANLGTPIATGSGSSAATEISFTSTKKRYIRIVQTGSAPYNYWSIHELALSN